MILDIAYDMYEKEGEIGNEWVKNSFRIKFLNFLEQLYPGHDTFE